jgi:hypothetical protein
MRTGYFLAGLAGLVNNNPRFFSIMEIFIGRDPGRFRPSGVARFSRFFGEPGEYFSFAIYQRAIVSLR